MDSRTLPSTPDDVGQRLDKFLAAKLPEFSRSRLQGLIEQGHVTCDEKIIGDISHKVKPGKTYRVHVPETVASHIAPQEIALNVVYEDKDILIINKPPGLTVHPAPGHADGTLVNALLAHCGASLSGIGGVARPGIVHRIDKDTSGLIAVAKNDAAHLKLSEQLATRSMKRTYLALVWGAPKKKQDTITGNIGRSFSNRQKMAVVKTGGKAATTHYKVVASDKWLAASKKNSLHSPLTTNHSPLFSLVECNLETGRTHQIRVHLTHIGHPLIGDPVYGQPTKQRLNAGLYKNLPEDARAALLAFNRQALHATALELIHPATERKMHFTAELPQDMKDLLGALKIFMKM